MTKLINDEEALRLQKEGENRQSALQSLIAGVQVPAANTPQTTKIDNPQVPEYKDNLSMLDNLVNRPLTPEDVERRKRAATSVEAIGQLGNLISAYSNLAGTSEGAAPQQIPGYQAPDLPSWEDRARQKQIEYANIMNGLTAQQWEQAYKDRQLAMQDAENKANRQMKQQAFEEDVRQFNENQQRLERQATEDRKERAEYHKGQVNASQTRADAAVTKAGSGGVDNEDTISAGGYSYTFNRRKGNDSTWSGMFERIPKDWVASQPLQDCIGYTDSPAAITHKYQVMINRYAKEHPEYMEDMMRDFPGVITRSKNEEDKDFSGWWNSSSTDETGKNWWNK